MRKEPGGLAIRTNWQDLELLFEEQIKEEEELPKETEIGEERRKLGLTSLRGGGTTSMKSLFFFSLSC